MVLLMTVFRKNFRVLFLLLFPGILACTKTDPMAESGDEPRLAPDDKQADFQSMDPKQALLALYNSYQLPQITLPSDALGNWYDSELAFVNDGQDGLSTKMALMDYARQSVRLQTFIFQGDESGQAFANKLIELVDRGVNVSVLVDDSTIAFSGSQNIYLYLTSHGVKVQGYRPVWMQIGNGAGVLTNIFNQGTNSSGTILDITKRKNRRYHEKMLVVDAEIPERAVAMVGGTNISNDYYDIQSSPGQLRWRDQDLVVRSAGVAAELARAFEQNLVDVKAANGNTSFSDQIDSAVGRAPGSFGEGRVAGLELNPVTEEFVATVASRQVPLEWNHSKARMIHHQPTRGLPNIEERIFNALRSAKREVIFVNPYFIPSEKMMDVLIETARRGVQIHLLTNSRDSGDSAPVQEVGRTFYKALMAETMPGVGGPQSQPIAIHEWGGDTEFKNGYSTLHAKYAVFDRQMAMVGSYNLDPRSQVFNNEVVVETDDPLIVAKLVKQFLSDSGPGFAAQVTTQELDTFIPKSDLDALRIKVLSWFKVFL